MIQVMWLQPTLLDHAFFVSKLIFLKSKKKKASTWHFSHTIVQQSKFSVRRSWSCKTSNIKVCHYKRYRNTPTSHLYKAFYYALCSTDLQNDVVPSITPRRITYISHVTVKYVAYCNITYFQSLPTLDKLCKPEIPSKCNYVKQNSEHHYSQFIQLISCLSVCNSRFTVKGAHYKIYLHT